MKNSHVYYLTSGIIALPQSFNIPTCTFNLATRGFNDLTGAFEIVTRNLKP